VLDAWRALGDRTGRTGLRGAWHVRTLTGHDAHVMSAGLSADGRTAVSSGTDGTVRLWDLRGGDCTRVLPVGESPVASVGLSADGRRALTSSINGIVRVWSAETGRCLTTVNVATGRRLRESRKVRFGTDGRLALVGEADALLLWDLESGRCLRTTEYPGVHAQAVWIGSGAGLVASSWEDGTVRLWNPGTGARQIIGDGPAGGRITSVCLSADQRRVLTGGGPPHRSGLRLWDVESGVVRAFEDGRTTYGAVRLTADGRFAVSGCGDAAVRVWDVAAGRCLRVLDGHQEAVSDIALTPDARFVLSAGDDGALRLWELDWELDARDPADRAAGARAR
jgi:WD40 repeat protein